MSAEPGLRDEEGALGQEDHSKPEKEAFQSVCKIKPLGPEISLEILKLKVLDFIYIFAAFLSQLALTLAECSIVILHGLSGDFVLS